jgi:hypothetical protein
MEFNVIGQGASSVVCARVSVVYLSSLTPPHKVRKAVYLPGQCFVALKCISVHEKARAWPIHPGLQALTCCLRACAGEAPTADE